MHDIYILSDGAWNQIFEGVLDIELEINEEIHLQADTSSRIIFSSVVTGFSGQVGQAGPLCCHSPISVTLKPEILEI